MGQYAAYIVPSYALTALVFVGVAVQTWLAHRRWRREVERLEDRRR